MSIYLTRADAERAIKKYSRGYAQFEVVRFIQVPLET